MTISTDEKDPRKFAIAIQQLEQGRSNATGTFTLTANASSTTVAAQNCGESSQPLYTPRSAHAAAEVGNGTIYVATVGNGFFTVAHANNAQTDRVFGFVCLG